MKIDSIRAFEKHLEGAKFSPLYFILGSDHCECQEAIDLLVGVLLPSPGQKEFSLTRLDGSRLDEQELGNALHSYSLFSKTQVIWIQYADKLKKGIQESLIAYFSHPSRDQTLILSASSWLKNTTFYKTAEKEGVILDFAELKPWEKEKQLTEWVNKKATAERKSISYPVCQYLVKRVGNDLASLSQEMEKLICFVGDRKEITQHDIEQLCHCNYSETIWQLGEAIFQKNAATALPIVHSLLGEGQPLLVLLRQIRTQFQTEFQIALLLAQGKQGNDITAEFPYLKGQILERHMRQAKQYGLEAFKNGLIAIDEAELRVKNSDIDDKMIAELLMIRLTHV